MAIWFAGQLLGVIDFQAVHRPAPHRCPCSHTPVTINDVLINELATGRAGRLTPAQEWRARGGQRP